MAQAIKCIEAGCPEWIIFELENLGGIVPAAIMPIKEGSDQGNDLEIIIPEKFIKDDSEVIFKFYRPANSIEKEYSFRHGTPGTHTAYLTCPQGHQHPYKVRIK